MTIHKEGYPTIILTLIVVAMINFLTHYFGDITWVKILGYLLSAFLLITVLQFFRHPHRTTPLSETSVYAPCDGKVVVIEEVEEPEYFKDKRIQLSIFMSPINVHVNRYPISGEVKYVKYHPGLYLVAWHPKSSTENERSTVVVEKVTGKAVLFRQIAGALARRIVYYAKPGDKAVQGAEFGFIKFGSRVDVFLPLGTKIDVQIGQKVTGGESILAQFV
jgi:phosphatidylserine decarboxylase